MSEKSGLDMIEELLREVKLLRKEMHVMDQKIAQIANSAKVSELIDKTLGTSLESFARSKPKAVAAAPKPKKEKSNPGIKNFKFERSDASKEKQVKPERGPRSSNKPTFVSGKMVTNIGGKQVKLSGLEVKIYDDGDKVIKQTRTNKAGQWMAHLKPGQYVVNIEGKYKEQDLIPINIPFLVKEGMKELEVS